MSEKIAVRRKNVRNAKLARAMKEREPKLVENPKTLICLKGTKSSDVVSKTLKDFVALKKPESISLVKRNNTRPFEDQSSIEYLSERHDASLFCFASHSKKRPHNLVMGRLFDYQLLDMVEFGVDPKTFANMADLTPSRTSVVAPNSKPCFLFMGEAFEADDEMALVKNLFLDVFRGQEIELYNLASVDHVIVCTAVDKTVYFRHYAVMLKKSGTRLPNVELEEVGPRLDLTYRRAKSAPEDMRKAALRRPKVRGTQPKKRKNIESGQFGDRMGRVHMQSQDLDKLELRKLKGLKQKQEKKEKQPGPTNSGGRSKRHKKNQQ